VCLGLGRADLVCAALKPFPNAEGVARVFLGLIESEAATGSDRRLILTLAQIHRTAVAGGCELLQRQVAVLLASLVREAGIVGGAATRAWSDDGAPSTADARADSAAWLNESFRGATNPTR